MIRISDLTSAAGWPRPTGPSSNTRADLYDPSTWFDGDAASLNVRISGDLSADARGLSVEQHAGRVLSFLCGERDAAG